VPSKRSDTDAALYCDACQLVLRMPSDAFARGESVVSMSCPSCGRVARVERLSDGSYRIAHKGQIFICPRPLRTNSLVVMLAYVGAFAVLALTFSAVTRFVHWALCPVVFVATLLAMGIIGATQLALQGDLNRAYVDLMRIFYKGLPYLLLRRAPEAKVVPDGTASRA